MQTSTIKRGNVVLGTISFENDASALGTEVLASAVFPAPDGDQTDQFASYEAALRFLHYCYEAHCEAQGVIPQPKEPEAQEVDEETTYHARLDAEAAAEAAYHDAQLGSDLGPALAEESGYLEAFLAAKPRLPSEEAPASDDSDDDLPF